MAQIVHDLAPGAKISFATAFVGEVAFAENIRGLAAAGASVIVDDVGYFEEPFFQDGPVAAAINEVVGERGRLLLGRRQRQPLRRRTARQREIQRQRNRLLGNAGLPRRRRLPAAAETAPPETEKLPRLRSRRGRRGHDLRDQGRERRRAEHRPAVGGTVERRQSRHRRLPARRSRRAAARRPGTWSPAPPTTSRSPAARSATCSRSRCASAASGRSSSSRWENKGPGNRSAAGRSTAASAPRKKRKKKKAAIRAPTPR